MATSKLELYEALKEGLGPRAAQMLTDALPEPQELATAEGLHALGTDLHALRTDMNAAIADVSATMSEGFALMKAEFAQVRGEMHVLEARLLRWVLGLFIPLWASTLGTLAAVLFLVLQL